MNRRVKLGVAVGTILLLGMMSGVCGAEVSIKGVKLVGSFHTCPNTEAIKKMIPAFEAKYGAKVTIAEETYATMHERQMAEFIAHTGAYDLIEYPYQWLAEYASGGHVADLYELINNPEVYDPAFEMDDWIKAVLLIYGEWEGGLYAIPNKFDIYIGVYRKDLYKSAGINPPATWRQLKVASQKLTSADIHGLAIPLKVDDPMMCSFHPFLWSYGGDYFDDNKYPIFNTESGVAAIQTLKSLLPFMPKGILNWGYDECQTAVQQGKIAYMLQWHAFLPGLQDPETSKVVGKIGYDLSPGTRLCRLQSLGGWAVGMAADSRHKEAAWKFIEFIQSKENALKFAMGGGSSARKSVLANPRVTEVQPWTPVLLKALENSHGRPRILNWMEVQHTIATGFNDVLLGEIDPEKGLNKIAAKVYEEMQRVGYHPEKTGPKPKY